MTVPAASPWPSNAELIEDVARLGYLQHDWLVLDPTWGKGTFWKRWRPTNLVCGDLHTLLGPEGEPGMDFTNLPFKDSAFDAVVFDPPYKLNGTPTKAGDERYGVHEPATWEDRLDLMRQGFYECARVLKPGGSLLVKGQDQVCSGAMRWQSDWYTRWAAYLGLDKVDVFYLLGKARKQPMAGRRQRHAHGKPSFLLVFRKLGV